MTELVGRRLGGFRLGPVENARRTTTTYRAVAEGRAYLVSVLAHVDDPAVLAALSEEAHRLTGLNHPNIVSIQATGHEGGYVYLVSEYVGPRRTLADLTPPMAPQTAVGLIGPLLFALEHAHSSGVIHRDVTPRRVMLPSPVWPMLTDFAVGRDLAGAFVPAGSVLGTPAYLAPEQAFGQPADARTDVYSTALVLYELLTGSAPFAADRSAEVLRRQVYEMPPPLRNYVDIPPELERVVLWALAKDPASRPGSAAEFATSLWAALGQEDTIAIATASESSPVPQSVPESADIAVDPLERAYAAGVSAFAEQRWEEAVDLLSGVAEVDLDYEDVESLLNAARSAMDSTSAS